METRQARRTAPMEKGTYRKDSKTGARAYPENFRLLYTEATGFRNSGTAMTARVLREIQAEDDPAPKKEKIATYLAYV